MAYKAKKSYGGKLGGFGARSGYFRPSWDPMPPYRQPSAPESEYSRKLKNSISRAETKGVEPILSGYRRYHINQQSKNLETGLSKTEVNALIESSLKDAFKKFVEVSGKLQVPDEIAIPSIDLAHDVASRFQNKKELNEVEEKSGTPSKSEISELNEIRQHEVNEKGKEMARAKTLDEVERISSEIRGINGKFFDQLDSFQNETGIEKAINEANPLLESSGLKPSQVDEVPEFVPATDLIQDANLTQKRRRLDYDSEVGW